MNAKITKQGAGYILTLCPENSQERDAVVAFSVELSRAHNIFRREFEYMKPEAQFLIQKHISND